MSSLMSFLGFDKKFPEDRVICIKEKNSFGCNGNFVISHLICTALKQKMKVCLLSLTNTENHYNHIATRLTVKLQVQSKENNFKFVDGLKLIKDRKDHSSTFKDLYFLTEKAIKELNDSATSPILFIIDDISALLNIKNDFIKVLDFYLYCRRLILSATNNNCFCVLSQECEEFEDEQCFKLSKSLSYQADIFIKVSGLESGFCKDIHGEIEVHEKDVTPSAKMHFKVEERSINLFPVGSSAAVLKS